MNKTSIRKTLFVGLVAIITLILLGGFFINIIYPEKVEDTLQPNIIMNSKVYPKHSKELVIFSHKKHVIDNQIECSICHHKKIEDTIWKHENCEVCHKEGSKPIKLKLNKKERIKRFHKDALHALCKVCHLNLKKQKKTTGPTRCNNCHKKD